MLSFLCSVGDVADMVVKDAAFDYNLFHDGLLRRKRKFMWIYSTTIEMSIDVCLHFCMEHPTLTDIQQLYGVWNGMYI